MQQQDYKNHIRFYTPHHFVFYPLWAVLFGISLYALFTYPDKFLELGLISATLLLVVWLAYMLRQHYALGNQDRIVRLEMRLRYYQLTHKRLEEVEDRLSFKQLAALRFASDAELEPLVQRTLAENLSPDQVKKLVQNWIPDSMRV
jgi:hypothetical protein